MTTTIIINAIAAAFVFAAVVTPATWAILSSRQTRPSTARMPRWGVNRAAALSGLEPSA